MMTKRTRNNRTNRGILTAVAILIGALFALVPGCSHKTVDDYLKDGDQAMRNTRLGDAEKAYETAAKTSPNDPRPHMALGNLYIFEQKAGPAELEYMKVLDLAPRNAAAHAALASLYATRSQFGLAEAQDRAAVALDPAKLNYRMSLGTTLQKEGKHGPAEAEFRTATGLQPKNAHAHLALANLLNAEPNRQSDAQAEYAQVKALDPSLMVGSSSVVQPSTNPTATPPSAAVAPPAAGVMTKIRDINRKFRLTRDSPVYDSPTTNAHVIAQVHRSKYVRATGFGGQWFRIQLRNGTVGFIPVTAAE
jgi:Flp pilus assembly protein TadD